MLRRTMRVISSELNRDVQVGQRCNRNLRLIGIIGW
jgi:hypothetical protein